MRQRRAWAPQPSPAKSSDARAPRDVAAILHRGYQRERAQGHERVHEQVVHDARRGGRYSRPIARPCRSGCSPRGRCSNTPACASRCAAPAPQYYQASWWRSRAQITISAQSDRAGKKLMQKKRRNAANEAALTAPGHEARHRRRRTLVDVRHPHVERHRRDLEHETDQDQRRSRRERARDGSIRAPSLPPAMPLKFIVPHRP